MLTGSEIKKCISNGTLSISPFDEKCVNPNSYNAHLGKHLKVYTDPFLDCRRENTTLDIEISDLGLLLTPNKLYLAETVEETFSNNYIVNIDGRSSIGRLGIFTHVTAGFGDLGYKGKWTLEIVAVHPIIIYPNMEIAQFYFEKPDGDVDMLYHGKYQNASSVLSSRLFKDFD